MLLKNGIIGAEQMDVIHSGEIVIWSVVGGLGTLVGPFVGASFVHYLNDFPGEHTERAILIIGLFFIITILPAPKGNRRVAHSGAAGSGVDRERRVMRPCGGAHLPAFAVRGNFGRARIVRLPSCKRGRERKAGKTPRAGVSGAGESIQNQK